MAIALAAAFTPTHMTALPPGFSPADADRIGVANLARQLLGPEGRTMVAMRICAGDVEPCARVDPVETITFATSFRATAAPGLCVADVRKVTFRASDPKWYPIGQRNRAGIVSRLRFRVLPNARTASCARAGAGIDTATNSERGFDVSTVDMLSGVPGFRGRQAMPGTLADGVFAAGVLKKAAKWCAATAPQGRCINAHLLPSLAGDALRRVSITRYGRQASASQVTFSGDAGTVSIVLITGAGNAARLIRMVDITETPRVD